MSSLGERLTRGTALILTASLGGILALTVVMDAGAQPGDGSPIYLPMVLARSQTGPRLGQVFHVPYAADSAGNVRLPDMAVFWFGRVDPDHSYTDVRLGYNDRALYVDVAVIDRRLWQAGNPTQGPLTQWDGATVYLSTAGAAGSAPAATSYRLTGQAGSGPAYRRAERGTGSGWQAAAVPFTTTLLWRGDAFNTEQDDYGWALTFEVPFASLGLSAPPPAGTPWALAVAVHDRDSAAGPPLADTLWPPAFQAGQPATWGNLSFGLPTYSPPAGPASGSVTLRQGLNGVSVPDAGVGGYTTCGNDGANMWTAWGDRVWSGDAVDDFANVQNQRDIADWPCFSKYYLTFPLAGQVPAGARILSATLTLHQTGGSGGSGVPIPPTRSLVQVLVVGESWQPDRLAWNNAPLPVENVARAAVDPQVNFPGWPGLPRTWDLTYGVARAMAAGLPELRLALYSADAAIHSGKYFATSDTGAFSAESRPTLSIMWGYP